jgi:hypothetical protein
MTRKIELIQRQIYNFNKILDKGLSSNPEQIKKEIESLKKELSAEMSKVSLKNYLSI